MGFSENTTKIQKLRVLKVPNAKKGVLFAKNLLYKLCDRQTVLFLSGGTTPKALYETLAREKKLNVGAAALVDERYAASPKLKNQISNGYMIRRTGLAGYVEKQGRFYPVLQKGLSIKDTALQYDRTVGFLLGGFKKSVGILGIGADGHTAGLPAGAYNSKLIIQSSELVTSIDNFPGEYRERVTLTFPGLSKLDRIIILVFGKEKKKALDLMFGGDDIYEVPARFFKTFGMAERAILITDLNLV